MFRDVPGFSGMFRVPGFIYALSVSHFRCQLDSNNVQPLSDGFLSSETNFQMHFIENSWFEILCMYF